MLYRVRSVAGAFAVVLWFLAFSAPSFSPARGQTPDAKPPDKAAPAGPEAAKEPQKIDEFAEAAKLVSGPAGNPECVWLGRRVVSLLWRDDLETAFRHLDLYDRFGCPGGHIQAVFRCLILHAATIDPKAPDSLNGRVQSCWLDPVQPVAAAPAMPTPPAAPAAAPSAAAPSATTNR